MHWERIDGDGMLSTCAEDEREQSLWEVLAGQASIVTEWIARGPVGDRAPPGVEWPWGHAEAPGICLI